MGWREAFLRQVGPGLLGGITFGRWVRLLGENGFAVAPSCWGRAMSITAQSVQNSLFEWLDRRRLGDELDSVEVPPPLFVLGHWRSGTTYLHNLLAVDERFAFPNNYQCLYPHTFLTAERLQKRGIDFFLPRRRPMDNVEWSMSSPQEDEFAQCVSSFRSPCLAWVFPERREHYRRYLTFRGVPAEEVARWQADVTQFITKLTWKVKRPLVLKSPPHTCRIRLLLEMYPQAKFVHIHRNPSEVFPSTKKTMLVNFDWHRLQTAWDDVDQWILDQYREMYDAFFEERGLIPSGHYCEAGYEELEEDPLGTVERIYGELGLPSFTEVAAPLERYVASLTGYQRNVHTELPQELRGRIAEQWRAAIEEWGY